MEHYTKIFLLLSVIAGVTLGCGARPNDHQKWASIKSEKWDIPVDFHSEHTYVQADIKSRDDKPVYKVICVSGKQGMIGIEYVDSGGFLCGMGLYKQDASEILSNATLLSSGVSAIYSRGNFNPEELVAACANYPDYGLKRAFILRNMKVEIQFKSLEFIPGYFGGSDWRKSFDFDGNDRRQYPLSRALIEISVKPVSGVDSEYAVESNYVDPKGIQDNCKNILTK